ncbi:iron complex transport system ATP-binding protein [Pelagirhabdus alkalitolerans]|uniref:Iron complex transport system ATP-binding protein n=1 Tax=Pelagirhabdus alkalitolerans TaxID=1612202 RepID=A0A1G6JLT4_9BACI|nr:ABC transporter ATP-binding protein [Pelagirhabdus alkalitolerans]SDC19700.1 iron complex transport system ATP-binding protein [Pelagirhabdus alkalitolerans]
MVIKLDNVGLIRDGKWILDSIDWQVKRGEHWAIVGLNGSGKSALLHLLSAFHFPARGEVEVLGRKFGRDVLGDELRQDIGLVSQTLQDRFFNEDSAYQIVLSGGLASIGLYETPTDEMREKAKSLLKVMGAFEYANRSFYTLSQGERQRVMIARALMNDPKLLILDEPTNGLDFIAKEALLDRVEAISTLTEAPTILYVTHHIDEILPTFSHVLLLKEGSVYKKGERCDILNESLLSQFFDLQVELTFQNDRPYIRKK